MDISTSMTQQNLPVSHEAVQAKVTTDPALQVESRSVPDAVSSSGKTPGKDADKLGAAVIQLNDFVQNIQRNLQFSVDQDSGEMVVKVIDANSKQVIRQIPSEEVLKLARSLAEQDDKAALTIFKSTA